MLHNARLALRKGWAVHAWRLIKPSSGEGFGPTFCGGGSSSSSSVEDSLSRYLSEISSEIFPELKVWVVDALEPTG